MASTVLVEIANTGARAKELVSFVGQVAFGGNKADQDSFTGACRSAVETGDYATFIEGVLDNSERIFGGAESADVEGCYNILFSFFPALDDDKYESAVRATAAAATASSEDTPELRLTVLANLYNLMQKTDLKLFLLLQVIQYASGTGQLDPLVETFTEAEEWCKKWGLSTTQQRDLFLTIAQSLDTAGYADEAQDFLIRFLSTFQGESPEVLRTVRDQARAAAVGYIKAPVVSQYSNLPALDAAQALKDDPEYAPVHTLLDIFASRQVADFRAFADEQGGLLEKLGVDVEASVATIRLLSLCSIAAVAPSNTLEYDALATQLEVDVPTMEETVVEATRVGLLDAKMDALARTVTVTRTTHRAFGEDQWRAVASKLSGWRENVSGVSTTIRKAKAAASGAATAGFASS